LVDNYGDVGFDANKCFHRYHHHHHHPLPLLHSSSAVSQNSTCLTDQAHLIHCSAKNFLAVQHELSIAVFCIGMYRAGRRLSVIIITIIIIIVIIISFMQGIYTHIPETNYVPREYSVAAILLLLFMVLISLVSVLNLLYFYIGTYRSMCAVPNMAVFWSIIIIIIIITIIINIIESMLNLGELFTGTTGFMTVI